MQVSNPYVRTGHTASACKNANMHYMLEATFQKCKVYALPRQGKSYFNCLNPTSPIAYPVTVKGRRLIGPSAAVAAEGGFAFHGTHEGICFQLPHASLTGLQLLHPLHQPAHMQTTGQSAFGDCCQCARACTFFSLPVEASCRRSKAAAACLYRQALSPLQANKSQHVS